MKKFFDAFGLGCGLLILAIMTFSIVWWIGEIGEYHDDVRGGRTIARLEQECDVREGLSEHVKLKALKARNIERLRKQVTGHDIDCELDYSENETDELQQHKNEMAFVGGMISSGMIDASDLEEE